MENISFYKPSQELLENMGFALSSSPNDSFISFLNKDKRLTVYFDSSDGRLFVESFMWDEKLKDRGCQSMLVSGFIPSSDEDLIFLFNRLSVLRGRLGNLIPKDAQLESNIVT